MAHHVRARDLEEVREVSPLEDVTLELDEVITGEVRLRGRVRVRVTVRLGFGFGFGVGVGVLMSSMRSSEASTLVVVVDNLVVGT